MKIYYLASAYFNKDPAIKEDNWKAVVKKGAELTNAGYTLFEPIAMCYFAEKAHGLPSDYQFWADRDREFIKRCDGVIFLANRWLPFSVGCRDEYRTAVRLGKPIYFTFPNHNDLLTADEALKCTDTWYISTARRFVWDFINAAEEEGVAPNQNTLKYISEKLAALAKLGAEVPPEMFHFLDVIETGAKKHAPNNWLLPDGSTASHKDMHASMFRHAAESSAGLDKDPDGPLHPLLNLQCRAAMMYTRKMKGIKHQEDK